MEEYIWDEYYKDYGKVQVFKNYKEYFNYLEIINRSSSTIIKNTHIKNDKENIYLDKIANKKNIDLVYTDRKHPIVLFKDNSNRLITFVNDMYFYMYQDKFELNEKKLVKNIILEDKLNEIIYIDSFILDEEFISFLNENIEKLDETKLIVNSVNSDIFDLNVKVNELNNINYEVKYNDDNLLFNEYTYLDLLSKKNITVVLPVYKGDFNYLEYLDENVSITVKRSNIYDEESYFNDLKEIFKSLNKNHNYNMTITVVNRHIFNESKLLSELPSNINLSIKNFDSVYTINEYLENDNKIQEFISYIKQADLSLFEKFMEANRFVSNFKKYNKLKANNKKDYYQSRDLKYILDNEYIVCTGYSELLNTILDELEIPCASYHTDSNPIDEKNNIKKVVGHRRNIVKIDDDKYDIHGIYLSDATYNNSLGENGNLFSIFTFDKLKGRYEIESLQEEDLLLDFHNEREFYKKINYYIKNFTNNKSIVKACNELYDKILIILKRLDYEKYKYFYDKYSVYFNENISNEKIVKELTSVLHEYYKYMSVLCNNEIDYNKIQSAIDKNNKTFGRKVLDNEEKDVKMINDLSHSLVMFPTEYDVEKDTVDERRVEIELYKNGEYIRSEFIHNSNELSTLRLISAINGYDMKIIDNVNKKKI